VVERAERAAAVAASQAGLDALRAELGEAEAAARAAGAEAAALEECLEGERVAKAAMGRRALGGLRDLRACCAGLSGDVRAFFESADKDSAALTRLVAAKPARTLPLHLHPTNF